MITTQNLQLLPYERKHIEALLRHKNELADLLQVTVPASWPHFPEAYTLSDDEAGPAQPASTEWPGYFFLYSRERALVGSGGFFGPPDDTGTVEIGYEIADEYGSRGFATEAAKGMIAYAFAHAEVQAVMAHTLAEPNASVRVLQKAGMRFVGAIDDPEEGTLWRWQINREAYHPSRKTQVRRVSQPF